MRIFNILRHPVYQLKHGWYMVTRKNDWFSVSLHVNWTFTQRKDEFDQNIISSLRISRKMKMLEISNYTFWNTLILILWVVLRHSRKKKVENIHSESPYSKISRNIKNLIFHRLSISIELHKSEFDNIVAAV